MKNFWLSWFDTPPLSDFELHSPWWVTGSRVDLAEDDDMSLVDLTICAAIQAADETAAKDIVLSAYDERPSNLEWRFCEERSDDWSPFNDRFPRGDWMQWPNKEESNHDNGR